jgi:predicted nucleic acid-binding protein
MSGINRQRAIYFDSCVYLAYLRNESGTFGAGRIESIRHVWREAQKGAQTIATSSITIAEVLSHKLEAAQKRAFIEAVRGLHICIDADIEVGFKASEIREYYKKNPVSAPASQPPRLCTNLETPDAIHLATCALNGCVEFWTFDGVRATTKKDKSIGLLWLGNQVAGVPLVICQPDVLRQATIPGFDA